MTLLVNVAMATICILLLIAGINAKWVSKMPSPFWANFRQEWPFNVFMFSALIVGTILGFFGYGYLQQLSVGERPEMVQIARVIVRGAGSLFAVGTVIVSITATRDSFRSDSKSEHIDTLIFVSILLALLYCMSAVILFGMVAEGSITALPVGIGLRVATDTVGESSLSLGCCR